MINFMKTAIRRVSDSIKVLLGRATINQGGGGGPMEPL